MNSSYDKSTYVQFTLITSDVKTSKSIHSLYNELLNIRPQYPLKLPIEELVAPARSSRRASQYLEKKTKNTPPRPPNRYLLFRKDFLANLQSEGKNLDTKEVSSKTSKKWKELIPPYIYFFQTLAELAKEIHRVTYPGYRYIPRKQRIRTAGSVSDADQSSDPLYEGAFEISFNTNVYVSTEKMTNDYDENYNQILSEFTKHNESFDSEYIYLS
ncbi:23853_t:CDS:1 [Dentiscutata erythropus]|uniref:23853_t:CDS:1 n=1 Tax=Dentiscutata erythropus TaxID=1348616 RepID=A0A9N8WQD1_9GLOM|nr:23853_t:CDS:1 [Dentiscutata erythropus]